MSHNKVAEFKDFDHLKDLKALKTIYLELCPVVLNPGYRQQIMEIAPWITQIDHFRKNFNITFSGQVRRKDLEEKLEQNRMNELG
jgi:hypothetical protein